ncbi:MAG: NADH-quinone oxidoreductase subunit G [Betaproteobacteria bacterium]|nr:NADH-quinone oxidoreductase subunit G [Betaproteobacteria bacterium]
MLKVEVDGRGLEVPHGVTVMEAANRLGIFVPHFCYHKKLSIAANCRMCLVQVEKAPKPMPACATPVTDGMKVWTHSEAAKKAQSGVMEFLLINHPLDCPICDQGGECQLQDLSVGYGGSASRYTEAKRVVFHKNLGPLVSAEEMSRCIHCTRCVRFGQEVAGVMELGMIGRGEHAEIVSFVGKSVDSELSGNMIDICPVGALTSKPFRYSARTWELSRRRTVSPHDSLGANLIAQTKQEQVLRVVPLENDAVNECWISDRDRFSYEGLNSAERLTVPMVREGEAWREADWQTALELVATRLREVKAARGPAAIGALVSPTATLEEMHLAQKLVRQLGSENVDFRLRQSDFSADGSRAGIPWLGMPVADIAALDRVLVVGSFLRKDHPLLAARLRQAGKRVQQLNILHSADDELLMAVANKAIVPPAELPEVLAQVIKAAAGLKGQAVAEAIAGLEVSDESRRIAASLASGKAAGIFLGNFAAQHPRATALQLLAQQLADLLGARFGFLGEAAGSVGGYVANCIPGKGGLNAAGMLAAPRNAYVLLGVEPELDCADAARALSAMQAAEFVVSITSFAGRATEYADVLLPLAPFTETSGTFVNCEGRAQGFNGVVRAAGQSRPGWKILRVLGNLLALPGFEQDSSEAVRDELGAPSNWSGLMNNRLPGVAPALRTTPAAGLQRVADVPIYATDPIVRRAEALQMTRDARPPQARMRTSLAQKLGLAAGDRVRVRQVGEVVLKAAIDERLPEGVVRIAAAQATTVALGPMFGELTVERA